MSKSRLNTIEDAIAKAEQPKPVAPGITKGMTDLQIASHVARTEKDPRVGGMTKLLYALPPEEQRQIKEVANLYAHHRDLGRHGNTNDVLEAFGLPLDLAEAVVNGLEVDYVAAELQRRMGSDGKKPLPDLTRRDYVEAAIDAHDGNEGQTPTEQENLRGHMQWGARRRKSIEDAYNFNDRLNNMKHGDTPGQKKTWKDRM